MATVRPSFWRYLTFVPRVSAYELTRSLLLSTEIAMLLHELGIQDQCASVPVDLTKGEQKEAWVRARPVLYLCMLVSLTVCVLVQYNNTTLCANGRVPCLGRHYLRLLHLPESQS